MLFLATGCISFNCMSKPVIDGTTEVRFEINAEEIVQVDTREVMIYGTPRRRLTARR
jgi:hypothetical protein